MIDEVSVDMKIDYYFRNIASINLLLPGQSSNSTGVLSSDGSNVIWSTNPYSPSLRVPSTPVETIVTNFQAGHGYVKGSQGTMTDDTSIFIIGNQSLRLTTSGNGVETHARKTSIAPVLDFTGKYVKVWVRTDDIANLIEAKLYLSSDNFVGSNFFTFSILPELIQPTNPHNNVWIPISFSWGDAGITGVPNRAAINAIQFRVIDNNVPVNAWINRISSYNEPTSAILTFTFDDGWGSQYTQAKTKLDQYGFKATAYIIHAYTDIKPGYMTSSQLKDLDNIGWDISVHDSTDLTAFSTQSDIESLLLNDISFHLSKSLKQGVCHFAYPNGLYNDSIIIPATKKYFTSCRATIDASETFPPADYMKLRVLSVKNTTTTAAIATRVTQAINNKEWLILIFHQIVAAPAVSTEYSITDFGTVVDNIATSGISVKTMTDIIRQSM